MLKNRNVQRQKYAGKAVITDRLVTPVSFRSALKIKPKKNQLIRITNFTWLHLLEKACQH